MIFTIALANIAQPVEEREIIDGLLLRLAAGDGDALDELYGLTSASVYSYALSLLKNRHDAEDVLHDCYVAAFRAAGQYSSGTNPMAWLITIARNLCYRRLRGAKRAADIPEEDWMPYLQGNDSLDPDEKLLIRLCMEKLTDEERQIVLLHTVSGFLHREIARLMDMPLPTVLSKYHRTIKKLRRLYEEG